MKKYAVRDHEAGNIIETFDTIEEAKNAITEYEEADTKEGVYEEGFYEIAVEDEGAYITYEDNKTAKWFIVDSAIEKRAVEYVTPIEAKDAEEARQILKDEWDKLTHHDQSERDAFYAILAEEDEENPGYPDFEKVIEEVEL